MLLTKNDPPPFRTINPQGCAPVIISAEHAANAVPGSLNKLGLSPEDLEKHIAYDPYAYDFAHHLAMQLDCPFVAATYSRLVVDCNRLVDAHDLVRTESDGIDIPANQNLSAAQKSARIDEIFNPFHQAIEECKNAFERSHKSFVMLSVHSFTPMLATEQKERPWDFGVLWDGDDTMAMSLYAHLKKTAPPLRLGLNEPYDLRVGLQGSMHYHAWTKDIPAVEIELNQGTMATNSQLYNTALDAVRDFLKIYSV